MREYFCGWYFKCQSALQTLSVIASSHKSEKENYCSVQFVTDEYAGAVKLPYEQFRKNRESPNIAISNNCFGKKGVHININSPALKVSGELNFKNLRPLKYDIMGPFRYVPFMECRHSVISMRHKVTGNIRINDSYYRFTDAAGYIEGDRGYSFPKQYAWTQCFFEDGSLMLSVADIPLGALHFTGIICAVVFRGKEYRLATYLGAKVLKLQNEEIIIKQGSMSLSARLINKNAHPLYAPVKGVMNRTIHESASCRAAYCFKKSSETLFDFESNKASFEYEYAY